MIALYSRDRSWRIPVEQQLRGAGFVVRVATRPAELAKCLRDGAVRLVLAGPLASDHTEAECTAGTRPLLVALPDETTETLVRRTLAALC